MKISDNATNPTIPTPITPVSPRPIPAVAVPVAGAGAPDKVTLSETAAAISDASQRVKAMPDVDMAKVADIKARIKNGTYQVNAEKAAANMLSESLLKG